MVELLVHALDVEPGVEPGELTHGFHTYPARFHPLLVRRLLAAEPEARRVLDPFAGSGTTLIEAALAGRQALGTDVNPLAVELARLKATPRPAAWIARLRALTDEVAARSADTVRASRSAQARSQAGAPRAATRYDDPRYYPPHVFRELVTLRTSIDALVPPRPRVARRGQRPLAEPADLGDDDALRTALLLVLTSIVVKVSRQRSDTDPTLVERNIARGAPTRLYAQRAAELCQRLAAFSQAVPTGTPTPLVRHSDARHLAHLRDGSVELVITSPPYLGTYDYAAHHARRFGWLGVASDEETRFARAEIGSRTSGRQGADEALARWGRDVAGYVAELGRVLAPGGRAYLVVGDSAVGERALRGDEALCQAAERAGFAVLAVASQARPDVYAPARDQLEGGKREHLVALQRRR